MIDRTYFREGSAIRHCRVYCLMLLLAFSSMLSAQLQISGSNFFQAAFSDTSASEYLDNYSELSAAYGKFRGGIRYEIHEPFAVFGEQPDGSYLAHRFLEFRHNGLSVRAGHFFGLLGRGLVLRSFEERDLRWNNNIDGLKAEYRHRLFDVKGLAGKLRITRSPEDNDTRFRAIQGGELRIKPLKKLHFGGSYLHSDGIEGSDDGYHRGSALAQLNFENFSFYGEYARLAYPDSYSQTSFPDGDAFYGAMDLFIGNLNLLGEYREYNNFAVNNGRETNPPMGFRDHLFTLLNRKQLEQNADDEHGFNVEAKYPLWENGQLHSSYSITEDFRGRTTYEDLYSHLELAEFFRGEWLLGIGRQEDLQSRYHNIVGSAAYEIGVASALKMIFEHQHARVRLTDRQYYDQLLTMEYNTGGDWGLSLLAEHSTDQFSDSKNVDERGYSQKRHHFWAGAQLDYAFLERFNLKIFAGSRRKGKICIGGVCVVKPELQGLELTLIGRL